jgi:pimeloyl-ACP methyl ester carboxylesterase
MIAQLLATRHPARVRSLASIMSTTGDRAVGRPSDEAARVLVSAMPAGREAFIEQTVANARAVSAGTAYPFDEATVRRGAARGYDRAYHPKGTGRQFAAILAAGGQTTAAAIPGARLLVVPGLGHELPPGFWPALADALVENADRADGAAGG